MLRFSRSALFIPLLLCSSAAVSDEPTRRVLVIGVDGVRPDHGGVGTNHGGGRDKPEIRHVFLIVSGDSAQKGTIDTPTYQVDVVATALKHLGVKPREEWELDGKPVGLK
jgi:hypothetical protein